MEEEERLKRENIFSNQLRRDFERNINNPKIKKITVNGKIVSKEEALKIDVFDVDTSIITTNPATNEEVLEIRTSK
ncbi:hypothetical protein AB4865_01220 [Capnocytophaga sp. ARDL2]|uniref:hypothetical protein n=1 Tax=Capnocytophaga sp. ARDL2 TaxID=3238809 RepID=UPI003556103B